MTTQEIKEIGKVKKLFKGDYRYEGKNFSIEFTNDECYWAIDDFTFESKNNKDVQIDFLQYETKKDLVWDLKCVDSEY